LPANIDRELADLERRMDELEASQEDHRLHRREMTNEEIIDLFVVLGEIAVVN
jgi:hypothetical protein